MAASPLYSMSNKLYQEYFGISISFRFERVKHSPLLDKEVKRAAGGKKGSRFSWPVGEAKGNDATKSLTQLHCPGKTGSIEPVL
jgi:hypothetical protein